MGTYCIKRIVIKHGMHWHYNGITDGVTIHCIDGRARAKQGGKAEWPRGVQVGPESGVQRYSAGASTHCNVLAFLGT